MEERILTLHPHGKAGVNISKPKYDMIRTAILDTLDANGVITFKALTETVGEALAHTFDGSIPWYVTSIKLDLEARGVIEQIAGKTPQHLRRV